jgi:ABC-2 type transport system ATP-binding protein
LLKVLAEQGKAILVSSHILTELSEICNGAVIIEQGRLLRAGRMDHIVSSDSLDRTVVIRCEGSPEELHRELIQTPLVREARMIGSAVEADVTGGDEVCGELLRHLILKEIRVVEFHQRRADLEDVFMTVTKGQVQ